MRTNSNGDSNGHVLDGAREARSRQTQAHPGGRRHVGSRLPLLHLQSREPGVSPVGTIPAAAEPRARHDHAAAAPEMPEGYIPERPYPGKEPTPWLLSESAALGQVLVYKCRLCRRLCRYLAADLLALYGDQPAYEPAFSCGKCKNRDYMRVDAVTPSLGDYGHLEVRRGSAGCHSDVADREAGGSMTPRSRSSARQVASPSSASSASRRRGGMRSKRARSR